LSAVSNRESLVDTAVAVVAAAGASLRRLVVEDDGGKNAATDALANDMPFHDEDA